MPAAPLTIDELLTLGRPIVLAHAGGEDERPHSLAFSFGEAVKAGVDMLDFDVQLTGDGVLVVQHDDNVERTTEGTGKIAEMTYDQLSKLDNAYWFTKDCTCRDQPDAAYIYRGIRTGDVPPPAGYTADDFAVPRFSDIVTRFPLMLLNIEIKGTGDLAVAAAKELAQELTDLNRLDNAVVTSFDDPVVDAFHSFAPTVEVTPGLGLASAWVLNRTPLPGDMRILQLPPEFSGTEVLTPEVITDSHAAGYVIWVWPNNREFENAAGYDEFLRQGMDGLNINFPAEGVAAVGRFVGEPSPAGAGADLTAAASAAQRAIDQGDNLRDCPFGPPDSLIGLLPASLPLAPGFATGVEGHGQVFSGGDVDITYCDLVPDPSEDGPIDEIRVDVSPGTVDLDTYLTEEFTDPADVDVAAEADLDSGSLHSACWDHNKECGAFWQGDGLFIGITIVGAATVTASDAVTIAETLVPEIIRRLTAATG